VWWFAFCIGLSLIFWWSRPPENQGKAKAKNKNQTNEAPQAITNPGARTKNKNPNP
jgi:hypothetical protein